MAEAGGTDTQESEGTMFGIDAYLIGYLAVQVAWVFYLTLATR